MSASHARRRLSLLTGSSMLAALVIAGTGGVTLAPTAAFAANECGDPATNAATADTFQCNGSFAAITYPATNGNLTLQLQNGVTTTTGGLVVTATGANTVTINRIADTTTGDPSLTGTSGAGLQVISAAGGAITVNLTDNDTGDTALAISGTTNGVLLRNAGTAATTFTTTNGTISASAGAAISATTLGTGAVTVTNGAAVTGSTYGVITGSTGAGASTLTNNGSITGSTGAVQMSTGTGNLTLNNTAAGSIVGTLSLNTNGTALLTNNGAWSSTGASSLGPGVSTITNTATGVVATDGISTIDFGAGADVLSNAGAVAAGGGAEGAATLTFSGLETWNNSGRVIFGSSADRLSSDGVANDRIVSTGTVFTGNTTSKLQMDVDFSADQSNCAAAVTADCFDLRGSSTAGSTTIVVTAVGDPLAAANRMVLVDVGGAGTSAASHFTLDETSTGYRLIGTTGAVERGMFFYDLEYDATAKQHALVAGAFNGRALELARMGRAASEPWRTATGTWERRQVDLRDTISAGQANAPGVWLKVAGNYISENRHDALDVGAEQVDYNTTAAQRTTAIVGGVDLVHVVGEGGAWVFGLTAGKINSTLEYRVGSSELELDGYSLGAYATLVRGPLYVDAIVNTTDLDLTHSDFGQDFAGSASSVGYQVEGGYRLFQVNDGGAYIEPLAAISYVTTKIDDLTIGPVDADFGEASSLRAALGLRVAGDMVMDALTAKLSFTGRLWKEFDGDNDTTLTASFGKASFADEGLGTLGDVGVAVGLFAPGGRLSANLGYSLTFGEGYQSSNASFGVRMRW